MGTLWTRCHTFGMAEAVNLSARAERLLVLLYDHEIVYRASRWPRSGPVFPWTSTQETGPTAAPPIYEGYPAKAPLTYGWPEDELNHALSSLNTAGLIEANRHTLAGDLRVYLTSNGSAAAEAFKAAAAEAAARSEVQARLARRADPALRRKSSCAELLRWLNNRRLTGVGPGQLSEFLTSGLAQHEGEALTPGDVEGAATDLLALHLVELRSAGFRIRPEGILCVEVYNGDVSDYQRNRPSPDGPTFKFENSTVHGLNVAGNDINIANMGIPAENLASFAQTLLRELPRMQLGEPQQAELREILTDLQQHSTDDSSTIAPGALNKMVGYLADAGKPVLTAVFALIARHWGGLPPA